MPVWATIIVGLGTGLVASVTGTLLTISHQRAAEFRSRMLAAAEDFLRRAEAVRQFARHPQGTDTIEPLDVLRSAWDDLISAVVLVQLLFGQDSAATEYARVTANELSDVEQKIRAAVDSFSEAEIQQHMLTAGEAMDKFGALATTQIRKHRR